MTDPVVKVGGLSVYGVRGVIVTLTGAAAMKTETHMIDRAQDSVIALPVGSVARITHKDGARFAGNAYMTAEEGTLVVAYADGTTVSLAL